MTVGKITVFTQVYNTEAYIKKCVYSVLSQSYSDFEYIIVDNGSTDGCTKILQELAGQDERIRLVRYETNQKQIAIPYLKKYARGNYVAFLDSDDWWESNYLERLVAFTEVHNLDVACTGAAMHYLVSGTQSFRQVNRPLIIPWKALAENLPWYHVFFRVIWGKLIRMELIKSIPLMKDILTLPYGIDTIYCFQLLRHVNRIGIDNSILYHYLIHRESISYQYNPKRFDSDIYLYNDAINFLASFGPVSPQNRHFLQIVYANAVSDTLGVIEGSNLTPAEKLRECARIAVHPITLAAYRQNTDDSITRSRNLLLQLALKAGPELKGQNDNDLRTVIQTLLPHCGPAVTGQNLPLIVQDKSLLKPFLADDPDPVLCRLLKRIAEKYGVKKYNLIEMVQALAADKPLLSQITDTAFLRRYGDIYLSVWRGEYYETLEEMTGLLLENRVNGGKKAFLELYISLAAALSQESAFIFGKLQMAALLLKQGDLPACRAVVADLEEMGLTDNEELTAIREGLEMQR